MWQLVVFIEIHYKILDMTLGEKIQISRKKAGLSQEDLANALNVSRQAVQKWESNASIPELNKLIEISKMFNVSLDWLAKEDINQENSLNNNTRNEVKEKKNKYLKAIKIFVWIGMILSPLVLGGSLLKVVDSPYVALFLLDYLVTIPLGIITLNSMNKELSRKKCVLFGILNLIFVSQIAAILMLAIPNSYINSADSSFDKKSKKRVNLLPLIYVVRVVAAILFVASIIILSVSNLLIVRNNDVYPNITFSYLRLDKAMFESTGLPNLSFYGFLLLTFCGLINIIYCCLKYKKRKRIIKFIAPPMSVLMILGSVFILNIDNRDIHTDYRIYWRRLEPTTTAAIFGIISAVLFLVTAFLEFDKFILYKDNPID